MKNISTELFLKKVFLKIYLFLNPEHVLNRSCYFLQTNSSPFQIIPQ